MHSFPKIRIAAANGIATYIWGTPSLLRMALQPARVQIPAYVFAFLALELFGATGPVPFVYFQF